LASCATASKQQLSVLPRGAHVAFACLTLTESSFERAWVLAY